MSSTVQSNVASSFEEITFSDECSHILWKDERRSTPTEGVQGHK